LRQYEEIPHLKGLLDAKEQLLERRNREIDVLKAEYSAIYRHDKILIYWLLECPLIFYPEGLILDILITVFYCTKGCGTAS